MFFILSLLKAFRIYSYMIKDYERKSAVDYARKWALGKNPNYYHFSGIGGDCTNFISQCLLAGGSVMNYDKYYGWFYTDVDNRSPSWTSVEYLQRFLLSNKTLGPFASIKPVSQLQVGDIVQLKLRPGRFTHSLIISKIERGEIYICAHSFDALDRPLSSYRYLQSLGLHIEGIYTND